MLKLIPLGLVVYMRCSLRLAPLETYPSLCPSVLMINILLLWYLHITCITTNSWHRTCVLVVLSTVQEELFDCFDYLPLLLLVLSQTSFRSLSSFKQYWHSEPSWDLPATASIRARIPSCTCLVEIIIQLSIENRCHLLSQFYKEVKKNMGNLL